jgi:hypothetical protein
MRLSRSVLALMLCALSLWGCSSGDECDKCTSDDDCQQGLVCTEFSDGSKRCGSGDGVTTCRTFR